MTSSADGIGPSESLNEEVAGRFGMLPNFFRTAACAPGLVEELWSFARSAYLDNPLPSLFKERLFVHLSRFCEVRYCIVRHVGFLIGHGRPAGDASAPIHTIQQVIALLERAIPSGSDLDAVLVRLGEHPGQPGVPAPEAQLELDLFDALTVVFLEPMESGRARQSVRRCLGDAQFEYALALLAFIRTAHYWTATHSEVTCEEDMVGLLKADSELAHLLLSDADAHAANPKTELRQALLDGRREEAKRVEVEGRFRALLGASSDAVYRMSGDWKQMHQLLGRQFLANTDAPDEKWVDRYIDLHHQPAVLAAIERALRTKSAFELEHEVLRADGSLGWVFSRAVPITRVDGTITEWLGTATDITERKRTEQAVLKAERLASIGQMAATISHEINNPLEAVTNLLFLARSTEGLPDAAREQLEQADVELRRVAHITQKALGFYRETASSALVDVTELMDSAIDLLKGKIAQRAVSIDKQWRTTPRVLGFAGELRQIFSNILVNSLDAIGPSGTITLRISKCKIQGSRAAVRITFADSGKGMEPAAKHHIFEPLYTTKGAVGTGLGLWVSQQLTQKHHGLIQMRSSTQGSHRGTTFSIVLPSEPTVPFP